MVDRSKTEETEKASGDLPRPVESLLDYIQQALKEIEDAAYKRGLMEGAARLEFWSCVVPASISKADLLESLKREAEALYSRCRK